MSHRRKAVTQCLSHGKHRYCHPSLASCLNKCGRRRTAALTFAMWQTGNTSSLCKLPHTVSQITSLYFLTVLPKYMLLEVITSSVKTLYITQSLLLWKPCVSLNHFFCENPAYHSNTSAVKTLYITQSLLLLKPCISLKHFCENPVYHSITSSVKTLYITQSLLLWKPCISLNHFFLFQPNAHNMLNM
jgi:hypothetical protein